jgi:hypothetical protein
MTAAHDRDVELVERFEADRKTYRSTSYKEEWIRQDFTDPLLESLGWDVTNKMSVLVGPQREVIPEEAIRVGGPPRRPTTASTWEGAVSSSSRLRSPRSTWRSSRDREDSNQRP